MFGQLPGYGDFRGFALPGGGDLPTVSMSIYGVIPIISRRTLKRHLFNMDIPKKLFKAIWGNRNFG